MAAYINAADVTSIRNRVNNSFIMLNVFLALHTDNYVFADIGMLAAITAA